VDAIGTHLEELVQKLGGLDLLVICSGTGQLNENLEFNIERQTINTNVTGFTYREIAFNFLASK